MSISDEEYERQKKDLEIYEANPAKETVTCSGGCAEEIAKSIEPGWPTFHYAYCRIKETFCSGSVSKNHINQYAMKDGKTICNAIFIK